MNLGDFKHLFPVENLYYDVKMMYHLYQAEAYGIIDKGAFMIKDCAMKFVCKSLSEKSLAINNFEIVEF